MPRIKVWGGIHANELLGMELVDSLSTEPLANIEVGVANLQARALGNRRFVDINMNAAFPGNPDSPIYEERRASEVLGESQGYYGVIDFHVNNYEGEDYAGVGSRGVRPELLGFLAEIGITRIVQSSFNSLREHMENCLLLEIVHGGKRANVSYWREAFDQLANRSDLPKAKVEDFDWYSFSSDVTVEQLDPTLLVGDEMAFDRLRPDLEAKLGLTGPQHWLLLNRNPQSIYWAELGTPISPPNAVGWPS